jgi:hypothetical protein
MRVRGLALPSEFVRCIASGVLRRERGSWPLQFGRDAFGNSWEAELGNVYETVGEIERASEQLPKHFDPDTGDVPEMFSSEP